MHNGAAGGGDQIDHFKFRGGAPASRFDGIEHDAATGGDAGLFPDFAVGGYFYYPETHLLPLPPKSIFSERIPDGRTPGSPNHADSSKKPCRQWK